MLKIVGYVLYDFCELEKFKLLIIVIELLVCIGCVMEIFWLYFKVFFGFIGLILEILFCSLVCLVSWWVMLLVVNIEKSGLDVVLIIVLLIFLVGVVIVFFGVMVLVNFGVIIYMVNLVVFFFFCEFVVLFIVIFMVGCIVSVFIV